MSLRVGEEVQEMLRPEVAAADKGSSFRGGEPIFMLLEDLRRDIAALGEKLGEVRVSL